MKKRITLIVIILVCIATASCIAFATYNSYPLFIRKSNYILQM